MKAWLILTLLLFSFTSHADVLARPFVGESTTARSSYPSTWQFTLQLGYDSRYENDPTDQQLTARTSANFAGGFIFGHWITLLEYASFETSSADGVLSVDRKSQSAMAWLYWQPLDLRTVRPYVGFGLGGLQDTVTTTLYGSSEVDSDPWSLTSAAGLGLRFFPESYFWLSLEGRVYENPHLDPNPEMGALLKIGFVTR